MACEALLMIELLGTSIFDQRTLAKILLEDQNPCQEIGLSFSHHTSLEACKDRRRSEPRLSQEMGF
jgi:hypothetical protein